MRIAQILYNKVHCIFEADDISDWPPYPDGTSPVLIDITDNGKVQEGWGYNQESNTFSEPQPLTPSQSESELTLAEMQAQTLLNTELLLIYKQIGM